MASRSWRSDDRNPGSRGGEGPCGHGRRGQIDPGDELVVRTGAGEDTDDEIHAGLEGDILDEDEDEDEDGDVPVLMDSAGKELARFAYGD